MTFTILLIFTALLGLIIGSFLNVVIVRLPLGILDPNNTVNLCTPRSHCPHCKKPIRPWHNIPLLSYCFLKGRCAMCQAPISLQYPLIELLTALASISMVLFYGTSWQALAALLFVWCLIPLIVIDTKHQLLPDALNYLLLSLGLLASTQHLFIDSTTAIIGAISGYLFFWIIAKLFEFFFKKEGLGHGDFKLLAALGAWVGWQLLPLLILIATFLGLLVAVPLIIFKKQSRHTPIPFGPFLAIAGFITLLWGNALLHCYLRMVGL